MKNPEHARLAALRGLEEEMMEDSPEAPWLPSRDRGHGGGARTLGARPWMREAE